LHTTYNPHDSTMMKVVIKSLGKHNNIWLYWLHATKQWQRKESHKTK
jgi:hypothetical protein